jgi:hypothetical protein
LYELAHHNLFNILLNWRLIDNAPNLEIFGRITVLILGRAFPGNDVKAAG